ALIEVRLNEALVDHGLHMVLGEDLDDLRLLGGLLGADRLEALGNRALVVGRALKLGYDHVKATVAEALRLRAALDPVADDRDLLALKQTQVRIAVVVHLRCHVRSLPSALYNLQRLARHAWPPAFT